MMKNQGAEQETHTSSQISGHSVILSIVDVKVCHEKIYHVNALASCVAHGICTSCRGEPEAARETSATERLTAVKGHVTGLKWTQKSREIQASVHRIDVWHDKTYPSN